jgi:predicted DNA-binding protein with PD1-like motif
VKSKLVSDQPGAQVHVVILDSGEEAFAALTKFANEAKISAASLTAIGAFEKATVGWFDFVSKSYRKIEVGEQCEVLSAIGDIAIGDDGKASLHVHIYRTWTIGWLDARRPSARRQGTANPRSGGD